MTRWIEAAHCLGRRPARQSGRSGARKGQGLLACDELGRRRRLLANAVRWCSGGPLPYETDASTSVEVNLARKGNDLIIHLINGRGKHPLDIRVRVIASREFPSAERLVNEGPLELKGADGAVELVLPRLEHYEAVVLRAGD